VGGLEVSVKCETIKLAQLHELSFQCFNSSSKEWTLIYEGICIQHIMTKEKWYKSSEKVEEQAKSF
jgi:hypothetical protein